MREALSGLALGMVVGLALAATIADCTAVPTPPACPIPNEGRFLDCAAANMSMAAALEALAWREDGCARFLDLGTTDPWIKYRLAHPKVGSGLSSSGSSVGSARSPASPASVAATGSTLTSLSGRMELHP